MASSKGLKEVGGQLDVTETDLADVRRSASKESWAPVVRIILPFLTFVAGFLAGAAISSASIRNDSYPYVLPVVAQTAQGASRKTGWTRTAIVSIIAFIIGLFVSGSMFSVSTLYSPHSR